MSTMSLGAFSFIVCLREMDFANLEALGLFVFPPGDTGPSCSSFSITKGSARNETVGTTTLSGSELVRLDRLINVRSSSESGSVSTRGWYDCSLESTGELWMKRLEDDVDGEESADPVEVRSLFLETISVTVVKLEEEVESEGLEGSEEEEEPDRPFKGHSFTLPSTPPLMKRSSMSKTLVTPSECASNTSLHIDMSLPDTFFCQTPRSEQQPKKKKKKAYQAVYVPQTDSSIS